MGCVLQQEGLGQQVDSQLLSITEVPNRISYYKFAMERLRNNSHDLSPAQTRKYKSELQEIQSQLGQIQIELNSRKDKTTLNSHFAQVHQKFQRAQFIVNKVNMNLEVSRELIKSLNALRINPGSFIPFVQQQINTFQSDGKTMVHEGKKFLTYGGRVAWEEAITFLKEQTPVLPVNHMQLLSRCAYDHCQDMSKNNFFDHKSSFGLDSFQRMKIYVNYSGNVAENLNQGAFTARNVIIDMLVDDGIPDFSHRKTIFNQNYRYGGGYIIDDLACLCLIEGMK